MSNKDKNKNFEMEDIDKHLKAEGKIREVHNIIDDLLASDIDDVKSDPNSSWKYFGLILALIITALGIWFWATSDQQSVVDTPQNTDTPIAPIETENQREEKEGIITDQENKEKESAKKEKSIESEKTESVIPDFQKEQTPKEINKEKEVPQKNDVDVKSQPIANQESKVQEEDKLIAGYFPSDKWGNNTSRGAYNGAPIDKKNMAKEIYNSGVYEKALKILEPLGKEYSDDWEILFYKGVCQLEVPNKNIEEAIQAFNQIIEHDKNPLIEDAEWMLVRALLNKGDKKSAENILNQIKRIPYHKYNAPAKQLNAKLDK